MLQYECVSYQRLYEVALVVFLLYNTVSRSSNSCSIVDLDLDSLYNFIMACVSNYLGKFNFWSASDRLLLFLSRMLSKQLALYLLIQIVNVNIDKIEQKLSANQL